VAIKTESIHVFQIRKGRRKGLSADWQDRRAVTGFAG
jgi:hypothetical protein